MFGMDEAPPDFERIRLRTCIRRPGRCVGLGLESTACPPGSSTDDVHHLCQGLIPARVWGASHRREEVRHPNYMKLRLQTVCFLSFLLLSGITAQMGEEKGSSLKGFPERVSF